MKLPYWNVDTDWTSMRKSIFGKQTGQNSREDLLPGPHENLTPRAKPALDKSTISGQTYIGCLVSISVLYSCSEIICGGGEEWLGLGMKQTITGSFLQMFFLLYLISISHNSMR